MTDIWWEDIEPGNRREVGRYTFTEDEIVAFARKYDPQAFHLDPEAARHTMFGGLIASGWHTAAVWMKLMIAYRHTEIAGGARRMRAGVSPGFEDMKWLKPVRPGMTLTYYTETTAKTELRSRADMGLVFSRNEARDEAGDLVFSFTGKSFVQRRPKGDFG
ncbi:MAG TPA: MaoC family dehydratase [Rhizomicrobium sp.]|nr:MaoC family dehydratase [Rhizomicrobium sp.]